VLLAAVALATPAGARAYGWPLKPFDRQHVVRGGFEDPREHVGLDGSSSADFHFGIDIEAADGAAVYAVAPGRVRVRGQAVAVAGPGGHEFAYWHVVPAVASGRRVRLHELLGHVARGWGHVHFAERDRGRYVNPLRADALTPYADRTRPHVLAIALDRLGPRIDLVAEAFDRPPVPVGLGPWHGVRLAPALVRWRLGSGPWRTAVDFRRSLYPAGAYDRVYAPGTRQNHPGRPGCYRFWLARSLDTRRLADGRYRLEVEALDTRGNVGRAWRWLTVSNDDY
jgi:peptidase M23-like protein